MEIIEGNNRRNIDKTDLANLTENHGKVIVDLGTGDGRFAYKKALENSKDLYIGIDPSQKQLEIYSKKAVRKKLNNVLFVLGSVENLPEELNSTADFVYIILPWGSLLKSVAKPEIRALREICKLLKQLGKLTIILGYNLEAEPSETERLKIEQLDENYIKSEMEPIYEETGFELTGMKELTKKDLRNFESTWSKKLAFGQDRPIFQLNFSKT